jgi:hypothetical protein
MPPKPKSLTSSPFLSPVGRSNVRRHSKYYFADGNAIFLVDDYLFNIHRYFLQTCEDSLFATMFSLPTSGDAEGGSDENPIRLEQVSVEQFEALLRVLYPRPLENPNDLPVPTYDLALTLAKKYELVDVRDAIIRVVTRPEPHPPQPRPPLGPNDPFDLYLTQAFEKLAFAVNHSDLVSSTFAIKHFTDICRSKDSPGTNHLLLLQRHMDIIAHIMNGRVWVLANMGRPNNQDCGDPAANQYWQTWTRSIFTDA